MVVKRVHGILIFKGDAMAVRALVVDYQPTIAYTLALVLRASGYEVRTEHSGEAALVTAMGWQPDLLIIEFILADMNGLECATRIRRQYVDCGVILLYVCVGDSLLEEVRRLGFGAFEKPVNPEMLLAASGNLTRASGTRKGSYGE
jgi:two-component system OmpR family response regulator